MSLYGVHHNQVQWRGVRPGYEGNQILINIDTAASAVLYTVPANKVLLLFDWGLTLHYNYNEISRLQVRNAANAVQAQIAMTTSYTSDPGQPCYQSTWVPIELTEGWDLYVQASRATRGYAHGLLIPESRYTPP